jgi:hypothetical protein
VLGKTISHYRILEKLGGGGMGVVYKAEDIKLRRAVALKFLPEESSTDPDALERFQREARAASALDHPNICTIYEIGECEGQPFIVMQFLEGHTLERHTADEPLDIRQPLEFSIQIAEGLAAAHAKGIIHRDIKPANIFVTMRNQIKILDFGLAKLMPGVKHVAEGVGASASVSVASTEDLLTSPGVALGTVAYMSPEQAQGKPVDQRTDLWSLGVVLYEMVTGRHPFVAENKLATLYSIVHSAPAELGDNIPTAVQRIVYHALTKVAADRYHSASEMIADLQAIDSGAEKGADTIADTRAIEYYRGLASATARSIDVFLSYNWRDHAIVEGVAQQLRKAALHPLLDRWYLATGQPWPRALDQILATCEAVVVFVGPGEMGPWQQRERDLALERQSRSPGFRVIPVLLPGSDPALGFLGQNTWVDLRQGTDDPTSLEILAAAVRGQPPSPELRDRVQSTLSAICPYRGLLYFREEDAPFFFGRDTAIDELADAVHRDPFVAVVGASGCGKSSVVRAGLVHRLRQDRENTWEALTIFPGQEPLSTLAKTLVQSLEPEMTETDRLAEARKLASFLAKGEVRLHDVAARILQKQPGTDRLLLVVDQWEELYTLTREEAVRRRFINEVLDAAERGVLRVVITLRGDFIGKALAYRPLSDRLQGAQQNLGPMTHSELERAVGGPAIKVGLKLEQGLTEILLKDVADEPGNLPLLEFVLKRLWEDRQGGMLTHAAYDAMGGLHGALAKRAETIFAQLTSLEQDTVRKVFLQMVRPGEGGEDTRRRASVAEIGKSAWRLVQKLADERLLVTAGRPGESDSVEVTHEALIYHWERLRSWVQEDREFLLWRERFRALFADWLRHNQDNSRLLPAPLLAEAQRWVSERGEALSDQERAFVAESARVENERASKDRESLRRERQNAARLRISIVALVAVVVTAMSALYLYAFTIMTFTGAAERADSIAKDVKGNLADHLQREIDARGLKPASLQELKQTWTEIIRNDPYVTALLKRTLGDSSLVAAILVTDENGQVLAASGPATPGAKLAPVRDFRDLKDRSWIENLRDLMTRREDYSTTVPIVLSGNTQQVTLFDITVLIQSVFLKHDIFPTLKILILTFVSTLFIAVCLASMLRIRYKRTSASS